MIESPTHVFSLLPGFLLFKEGWLDVGFTYTWIRDRFLLPGKEFYSSMRLSPAEQEELMRRLSIEGDAKSSSTLERFCLKCRHIPEEELAAFLYRTVPLVPGNQCKAVLQELLGIEHPSCSLRTS